MKLFLLVLLFSATDVLCQNKIFLVVDSVNKTLLTQVAVYNSTRNIVKYTNESGIISIRNNTIDTFTFQLTGFYTKTIITPLLRDTIFLISKETHLETITVKTFRKKKKFGVLKTNNAGSICYDHAFELATKIKIDNNQKPYKLNSVYIFGDIEKDYELPIFCKVRLYSIDTYGRPGRELLDTPINLIRADFKKKRTEINLKSENLILKDPELFIGVEFGITDPGDYGIGMRVVNFPMLCVLRLYAKNITEFFKKELGNTFIRVLVGNRLWQTPSDGTSLTAFAVGGEIIQ